MKLLDKRCQDYYLVNFCEFQIFIILRPSECSRLRVQFSSRRPTPNLRTFFLAALPPPLVSRRVHRFAKSDYCLCNVCPSVCVCLCVLIDHLSSYWKDFHETWHLNIFRKSDIFCEYHKNNGHLTWRFMYIYGVWMSSF